MSFLRKFQEQRQSLVGVRYDDGPPRLERMTGILESEPLLGPILADLRVTAAPLIQAADWRTPPKAGSPHEVAAVGMHLLDRCKAGEELYQLSDSLGIDPPFATNSLQYLFEEPLKRFIFPCLDFISDSYQQLTSETSLDSLAEVRQQVLLSAGFRTAFPLTSHSAAIISSSLRNPAQGVSWSDVGNSIRAMLITFAQEIRVRVPSAAAEHEPQANFKGIVRELVKERLGEGRFAETLTAMLVSVWDHAQPLTHRPSSSRADAERCFLVAGVALAEMYRLVLVSREAD